MKRFRNFSLGFTTFLIVYFIFLTMNEFVAQLIFYFGLTMIGLYIFRLLGLISLKLYSIMKDIEFCDCGFWNKDGNYNWDIKLVDFKKEPYTENETFKSQAETKIKELEKLLNDSEIAYNALHKEYCLTCDNEDDLYNKIDSYKEVLNKIEEYCKKDIHTFAGGTIMRYKVCDNILDIINKLKDKIEGD